MGAEPFLAGSHFANGAFLHADLASSFARAESDDESVKSVKIEVWIALAFLLLWDDLEIAVNGLRSGRSDLFDGFKLCHAVRFCKAGKLYRQGEKSGRDVSISEIARQLRISSVKVKLAVDS
jgi:hypothetical protein